VRPDGRLHPLHLRLRPFEPRDDAPFGVPGAGQQQLRDFPAQFRIAVAQLDQRGDRVGLVLVGALSVRNQRFPEHWQRLLFRQQPEAEERRVTARVVVFAAVGGAVGVAFAHHRAELVHSRRIPLHGENHRRVAAQFGAGGGFVHPPDQRRRRDACPRRPLGETGAVRSQFGADRVFVGHPDNRVALRHFRRERQERGKFGIGDLIGEDSLFRRQRGDDSGGFADPAHQGIHAERVTGVVIDREVTPRREQGLHPRPGGGDRPARHREAEVAAPQ